MFVYISKFIIHYMKARTFSIGAMLVCINMNMYTINNKNRCKYEIKVLRLFV